MVAKRTERRSEKLAYAAAACLVAAASLFSCAGPEPRREVTLEERIREDNRIGQEMSADFESRIDLKKNVEVSIYLRKVAQRLADISPELRGAPLGVFLVQDSKSANWKNYSLPGNRIYLSVNVIKRLDYENELAGLMAFELSHILNRHVLARLQEEQVLKEKGTDGGILPSKKVDFFGGSGLFSFTDENRIQSAETAVSLMYKAGYDPRGMVGLWNRYTSFGSKSPYEPELLSKLVEKSRESIAYFAPLRNPVVRSDAFLSMKRRIESL